MDSQFNTLIQSYHDNYVEYAVTGDSKYQTAYQKAEEGIKNIIQAKQDELNSTESSIHDLLGTELNQQINTKQSILTEIGVDLHNQRDRLTGANMRAVAPPPPVNVNYTGIIYLLVAIVVLQLL